MKLSLDLKGFPILTQPGPVHLHTANPRCMASVALFSSGSPATYASAETHFCKYTAVSASDFFPLSSIHTGSSKAHLKAAHTKIKPHSTIITPQITELKFTPKFLWPEFHHS